MLDACHSAQHILHVFLCELRILCGFKKLYFSLENEPVPDF